MERQRFEIEDTRRAESSPDAVLERVATPSTWPEWQSEILSVDGPERVQEGDVVRGDARLLGFGVEGHSSILEVTPESVYEDVIVGVRMRIRYSVAADGDGAVVTHHLVSDLPRGPAGRVLALLLKWRLRKMQRVLLDDLVRQTASGGTGSSR